MNFFGYSETTADELLYLSEVTVQASPEKLRRLSTFLSKCADEIEQDKGWEHERFSGVTSDKDCDIDFIVFRESK